jgi:hypothetical protein
MTVQFIKKIHNKIQNQKRKKKNNDSKMKFDLRRIVIHNDSEIAIVTITKVPIQHKPDHQNIHPT